MNTPISSNELVLQIAINNLKNLNDGIRAHAVELLSLVAPPEEQNNLITFFKNLDLNQRELTEKAITLISDFIDHQTQEVS